MNTNLFSSLKLLQIIDYELKYNNKFIIVIYVNLMYVHKTTQISLQFFINPLVIVMNASVICRFVVIRNACIHIPIQVSV